MKKVLSTLLALTLCASMLAGCGGNSNSSSSAADSSASESSSSTSSTSSESSASESESSSEAGAQRGWNFQKYDKMVFPVLSHTHS